MPHIKEAMQRKSASQSHYSSLFRLTLHNSALHNWYQFKQVFYHKILSFCFVFFFPLAEICLQEASSFQRLLLRGQGNGQTQGYTWTLPPPDLRKYLVSESIRMSGTLHILTHLFLHLCTTFSKFTIRTAPPPPPPTIHNKQKTKCSVLTSKLHLKQENVVGWWWCCPTMTLKAGHEHQNLYEYM